DGDDLRIDVTGSFADANAGKDKIVNLVSSYGGEHVDNYLITDQADTTADITPRPVDVTAIDATKTYGDADPALTYTVEAQSADRGLVAGDTLSGALDRAAGEDVGTYAIGQGT